MKSYFKTWKNRFIRFVFGLETTKRLNERGVSTALVMTFTCFLGVSLFLANNAFFSKSAGVKRFINARSDIVNSLKVSARSPSVISNSAAASAALSACTSGACPTGVWTEFNLMAPSATGASVKLGGPASNPGRFSASSSPCSAPSAECLFEVITEFSAICDDCVAGKPNFVQVRFSVRQSPAVKHSVIPVPLQPVTEIANRVSIAEVIYQTTGINCPPLTTLAGFNPDGTSICKTVTKELGYEVVSGTASTIGPQCGWTNKTQYPVFNWGTHVVPKTCCASGGCWSCPETWPVLLSVNYFTTTWRHVSGSVCCPAGKIVFGGGGNCSIGSGGWLEIDRKVSGNCWHVDCCKETPFPSSPIYAVCLGVP